MIRPAGRSRNLDGVFLGCKHATRAVRPHGGGSIVNISSCSGLVGIPGAAAYAAAKAAVHNHTKTVALYCAEQGLNIRCNSIRVGRGRVMTGAEISIDSGILAGSAAPPGRD